ncbi:hypothetical protein TBLA_0E04170 [Henningerozyma blattae CBS 6284]|uniref:glutathione-specific gamma-glutamylcyclotransferase n=1 Tax=Henningerozyma blattae (strain ATCC 34711 / CBS 6284 / DSM 70876 / NBRC 10599 / NRRL Y-10934 / UCD 77-7) TaxID=1071380 RepID=I2H520_HENB6|nr:hypothetical protein TBLA_0E04170 [Tetrapisispora blattae CBS 6284]CCH61472.1 hypothetical protein TBLA_0E04170 [Tetrapisispora blattae CBS 6284]
MPSVRDSIKDALEAETITTTNQLDDTNSLSTTDTITASNIKLDANFISTDNTTPSQNTEGIWVLGYGSLLYKPPPHFTHRVPCRIPGYTRRFWQSSIDHRGTPDSPGRVATLVPLSTISNLDGNTSLEHPDGLPAAVYYIPPSHAAEVRANLDIREQNGYDLVKVEVHLLPSADHNSELNMLLNELEIDPITQHHLLLASVYVGVPGGEAYIGPEEIIETAKVIATSIGPSGTNYEYLKKMCTSLDEMVRLTGVGVDPYLIELLDCVETLRK